MITLLRALAGLILGMVVFAGLIYHLVVVNFSQRLENPEVYNVAINDTDAYNRIYDEVLVDEALDAQTANLVGDLDIAVNQEAVEVLKDVMPPAYLREQTEDNIERFTGFLRHDLDDLEIYVGLKEPLGRIEPAVLDKVHRIIDELEIKEPETAGCSLESVQRLAAASAEPYARLSEGELPQASPSLGILTRECRQREFDRWFDLVLDDPAMNSQAALILDGRKEEIRESFVEGDTRAFLKVVADSLVEPQIEDAVVDIRRNLQRNDRFDVLQWMADESDDLTREEIREQAESLRDVVSAANGPGKIVSLLMVVLGCLLMALVHLPRPAEMLRWPGITLAMGGGVCLASGDRAEFGHTRPDQGGNHQCRGLFGRSAGICHQPGGRSVGVFRAAGDGGLHPFGGDRDSAGGYPDSGVAVRGGAHGGCAKAPARLRRQWPRPLGTPGRLALSGKFPLNQERELFCRDGSARTAR